MNSARLITLCLLLSGCSTKGTLQQLAVQFADSVEQDRASRAQELYLNSITKTKTKQPSPQLKELCDAKATAACELTGVPKWTPMIHPQDRLSIYQGLTTKTETYINVLRHKHQELVYLHYPLGAHDKAFRLKVDRRSSFPGSDWIVEQFHIKNLNPGVTYLFDVIDQQANLIDRRQFKNLDLDKSKLRFSVSSCMNDHYAESLAPMLQKLNGQNVDLHLFIGDNVYADKVRSLPAGPAHPEQLWDRYSQSRRTLSFYKEEALTPVLAIWDDHDYGVNNGGADYEYKGSALEIFQQYFSQPESPGVLRKGPGASFLFQAGKHRFAFMDDRYFRTPTKVDPNGVHWGKDQLSFFEQELLKSNEPVYLINGNQFFGAYQKSESVEGYHPADFKKFRAKLRSTWPAVVFLSGDRHLLEIMKVQPKDVGYSTLELTSSGIHADITPASKNPRNPRQIFALYEPNYLVVESQVQGNILKMKVKAFGQSPTEPEYLRHFRVSKSNAKSEK
ncbi:MAG: hypothetical protein CL675_03055 [Bdellovibrionaceae bacterium]|nr:hypothetical protein [Pseudobdellovibrionaceae bacterium]